MPDPADAAPASPPADPDAGLSLLQLLRALLADLPGLFTDRVELLSLELRRARDAAAAESWQTMLIRIK